MASKTGEALARPAAPPLIGHLPAFRRRRLSLLERCASSPGAAVSLRIGGPALLLKRPEDVRHVLVSGAAAYEKSPRATGARSRRVIGDSLFAALSAQHRPRRRRVQPAFRHDAAERLAEPLARLVGTELGGWRAGSRPRLALQAAALPAAIVLCLVRAGRLARGAGWGARFAASLPLQIVGHVAWCAGECRAWARLALGGRG